MPRHLVRILDAILLIAVLGLSLTPSTAGAASRSSKVIAYVTYDDSGFSEQGPPSANLFSNAIVGGPSSTNSATASVSYNGMTFTPLVKSALSATTLAGFDTLVLFEVCDIATSLSATQHQAINDFLKTGNKILLFDADRCAPPSFGFGGGSADYSWFQFPFATSNPGPRGAAGTLQIVENSTLTQGLASDPFSNDELGDANTATTSDPHWFAAAKTTNALGNNGYFLAYARNSGLIIYNGADYWFTDGPTKSLTDLFLNELNQVYDPDNLPGTTPIAGGCAHTVTGLTPASSANAQVQVRAIEVTQAVQDWCDSVPLIAGKATVVRVHLEMAGSPPSITASARLQAIRFHPSGATDTTAVDPQNASVIVPSSAETARGDLSATLNFLIPPDFTIDKVQFTVLPTSTPLACGDPTSTPSACAAQVTFVPSPSLHVVLIPISYTGTDPQTLRSVSPPTPNHGKLLEEARRLAELYPVALASSTFDVDVSTFEHHPIASGITPQGSSEQILTDVLGCVNQSGTCAVEGQTDNISQRWMDSGRPNTVYVGVIEGSTAIRDGASGKGDQGPNPNACCAIVTHWADDDKPYQDAWLQVRNEIGHEIAHTLGLVHPTRTETSSTQGYCGETAGPPPYFTPSVIVNRSFYVPYANHQGEPFPYPESKTYEQAYPSQQHRAYSLGPMESGVNNEVWGFNIDAFNGGDTLHAIVDPNRHFAMMSYCIGTDSILTSSKYQWIAAGEWQAVISALRDKWR